MSRVARVHCGAMAATLARLIEIEAGRVHALTRGRHRVGRARDCDVHLQHRDVSQRHAELEVGLDGIQLRDLASKNGIYVDGRRVSEARLRDGSRIALGGLELRCELVAGAVDRVLANSGEVTVRRARRPALGDTARPAATARPSRRSPVVPLIATAVFAALLVALLVIG